MINYYNPKQIAEEFADAGVYKSNLPRLKFYIMATLGGVFIAFGGLLSVVVAGGMAGIGIENPGIVRFVAGAVFPIGLIMVSITGADLFTSDCAGLTMPLLQKRIQFLRFIRLLILSYIFNFIGSQVIAYLLSSQIGMFDQEPWRAYLHHGAQVKTSQDFMTILIKGIGANWLVCLGVWMGYAAKDIIGKYIGIWIPVMLFVVLGYEHSIANMFFIPAAIYSGADITWNTFVFDNLIPATIGNFIGGSVLVGCVYWYLFLKEEPKN